MDELFDAVFASFALQQDLELPEIAAGVADRVLPDAQSSSPEWFAQPSDEDDVLSLAPELREDISGNQADLVSLYGGSVPLRSLESPNSKDEAPDEDTPDKPVVRMDLLREISHLDE